MAMLVISTDLDELPEISDRIAVMFQGRLTGIVANAPIGERRVGALMTGAARHERRQRARGRRRPAPSAANAAWCGAAAAIRVLISVVLALFVGGIILLVLGKIPSTYYGHVLQRGLLSWGGLQQTLTRMAPLLLIAAGLIVAFRAGIWNLGGDGQFLLGGGHHRRLRPGADHRHPPRF